MTIINDFNPFIGQHCETTATGTLLKHMGINLSEAMLFGLGEGLGYIFWFSKNMDFPFIGGRTKPDLLSQNLARNLNLHLETHETASKIKAWLAVKEKIDQGIPVGLKLDCYHLDYFKRAFHFAAHYIAIYGYDEDFAYLVDTINQGSMQKTSLTGLAAARSEKGPMSSKNLSYTLTGNIKNLDLKKSIVYAVKNNAEVYLSAPIANLGYRGIEKTGKELVRQIKSGKIKIEELAGTALVMERGGTGGTVFRNMYRDFLKEAFEITGLQTLNKAGILFSHSADKWNQVIQVLEETAKNSDLKLLENNANIFPEISDIEKEAMEILSNI